MHNKPTLTSIPERSDVEEDVVKWVSKKKHEVLKAKYKCLKKLFQIYDASVIGILPETYSQETQVEIEDRKRKHRRKKSRRAEIEASAVNSEVAVTENTAATAVIKDLQLIEIPSETNKSKTTFAVPKDDKSTQDFKETILVDSAKNVEIQHPVPYLIINEKRKPTRFQSFIQRILGIRRERKYTYVMPNDRAYAASDNNLSNRYEKRRRRGLRLRRSRRPKKTHSEIVLRDAKSPVILSYVQSIQKNCLMDTTPRHCPIVGCKMLLYGIINYNDHLNLCHFNDRAYVCVYCHEGFAREHDKAVHENEHIGITKLDAAPSSARFSTKIASITQTDPELPKIDVPEDKLKKIVSFFDKLSDPDQILAEFNKNPNNLYTLHRNPRSEMISLSGSDNSGSGNKMSLYKRRSKVASTADSEEASKDTSVPVCGDSFDYRDQLNLHVDQYHRAHDKFIKYNSCAGILNRCNGDGSIRVQSATQSLTKSLASTDLTNASILTKLSRRKSDETLSYDPSTNIVYYTSTESVKKPSLVQKVRSGFCYKWEPGTKIIRV